MLFWIADRHKGKQISIFRETYNSFKTTLFLDFNRRFPEYGIPSPTAHVKECQTFELLGNRVNLIGADKASKAHGAGSDFAWFNEPMFIQQDFFDQIEMRNRIFWWMDYNPVATKHWIYDAILKRPDVAHLVSTMLDNPWISDFEKAKILSYEPTPLNISQGTANEYKWKVYGLGQRAQREGCIITNWRRGEFDESLPYVWVLDFGFTTDPTAFGKVARDGRKCYVKGYRYETGMLTSDIIAMLEENIEDKDDMIIADSAEPRVIAELQEAGFNVFPCQKGKGSVLKGIDNLQDVELIVDTNEESDPIENEILNWVWLEDKSNTPIDDFNHYMDAIRYGNDELKGGGEAFIV